MKKLLITLTILLLGLNVIYSQTNENLLKLQDSIFAVRIKDQVNNDTISIDQAIEIIDEYLQKHPKANYTYNLLASIYTKLDDYEKADSVIKAGLKQDSTFAPLWASLGNIYFQQDNTIKAIKYFKKASDLAPDSIFYTIMVGAIYLINDDYETALDYFKKSLKQNSSEANYYIAYIYKGLDSLEKAYDYIKKATEAKNKASYLILKADIELKLNKFDEALKTIEKAEKLYPNNTDILDKKVILLYNMNRYEDAIEVCRKAIAIKPQKEFYEYAAIIYDNLSEPDSAISILYQGLKQFPDDDELLIELSKAYRKNDDYENSYYYAKKAIEVNPYKLEYYLYKNLILILKNSDLEKLIQDPYVGSLNVLDYKKFLKQTKKKKSIYSFKKVSEKFYTSPQSLSLLDFLVLYYGSVNYYNYDNLPSSIDELTNSDSYITLLLKTNQKIREFPFIATYYKIGYEAAAQIGDLETIDDYTLKYIGFLTAISVIADEGSITSPYLVTNNYDIAIIIDNKDAEIINTDVITISKKDYIAVSVLNEDGEQEKLFFYIIKK